MSTTVEEMGKVFVTTELGGGGTARAETVAIAKRGAANVLRHAGILHGAIGTSWDPFGSTCHLETASHLPRIQASLKPWSILAKQFRKGN